MIVVKLLFGTLVVTSYCCLSVLSWDDECKGQKLDHGNYSDVLNANLNECLVKTGLKSFKEIKSDNRACFGKCILEKQGLIDKNGKIDKAEVSKVGMAVMPEELREEYAAIKDKCLEDFADQTDYTEPSCNSYAPLLDCMHNAFLKVCEH